MTTSRRLPTAAAFANLGSDQGAILDWHRRQLDDEEATFTAENLKSGYTHFTKGMTLAKFKRSLRDRRVRLDRLAAEFGFVPEGAAA